MTNKKNKNNDNSKKIKLFMGALGSQGGSLGIPGGSLGIPGRGP